MPRYIDVETQIIGEVPPGSARPPRDRLGRCWKCHAVYTWPTGSGVRRQELSCPGCGGHLAQTSYHTKSVPWFELHVEIVYLPPPQEAV